MIKTETQCIYRLFFVLSSTAKLNIFPQILTDILDVGESTQDVGELTVGEATVIRDMYY